jgi:hypothetical protein
MGPPLGQERLRKYQEEFQKFANAFKHGAENWKRYGEARKAAKRTLQDIANLLLKTSHEVRSKRPDLSKLLTVKQLVDVEKKGEIHDMWGKFIARLHAYVTAKVDRWEEAKNIQAWLKRFEEFSKKLTQEANGHRNDVAWGTLVKQRDLLEKQYEDLFEAVREIAGKSKPSEKELQEKYLAVKIATIQIYTFDAGDL